MIADRRRSDVHVGPIVLVIIILATFGAPREVYAQARFHTLTIEIGWSAAELMVAYGEPEATDTQRGYTIVRYDIEADLGIGRPTYNRQLARVFFNRKLYLALKDGVVRTSVAILFSKEEEAVFSFFETRRAKNIQEYGRMPDSDEAGMAIWVFPFNGLDPGLSDTVSRYEARSNEVHIVSVGVRDLSFPEAFEAIKRSSVLELQ